MRQLRETGMNWTSIARCLGISVQTLYRRRMEFGVEDNFTEIVMESIVTDWQTYGIDYEGPWTNIETDTNVVVLESPVQLTDHLLQELHRRIDPISDDGNNVINHFLNTVTIIEGFIQGTSMIT